MRHLSRVKEGPEYSADAVPEGLGVFCFFSAKVEDFHLESDKHAYDACLIVCVLIHY